LLLLARTRAVARHQGDVRGDPGDLVDVVSQRRVGGVAGVGLPLRGSLIDILLYKLIGRC